MSDSIPFQRKFNFKHEIVARISPLIRRIVAHNPNFFTFHGTNTYIIGNREVVLVDPGPDIPEHLSAILKAIEGETVSRILVTHSHIDHWPAAVELGERLKVPTCGFDPLRSTDKRPVPSRADVAELSNQECYDLTGFNPDIALSHGEIITGKGWSIECVYTPGHASNHLCYQVREERTLLSGDHVMGWSTSVISPPSGNMKHYMESLNLLLDRDDVIYLPAHGPEIKDPKPFVQSFINHRKERERQILDEIQNGLNTIEEMVPSIYRDVPSFLHPAAERSILAAVIYMVEQGVIGCDGSPGISSPLRLMNAT